MRFKLSFALFAFVLALLLTVVPHAQVHAQTGCTNNPTSTDTVSATVSISQTGTYTIWSRILAPDTTNNSYYLQIDGGCAITVGDATAIPANTWTWVNYQDGNTASITSQSLTAGDHTVKLISREGGVGVDKVQFVTDTCVPTGTGDNCVQSVTATVMPSATTAPSPTPTQPVASATATLVPPTATSVPTDTTKPTVSITSPTNGSTVQRNRTITLAATASDNVGVARVVFTTSSGLSCTDTTAPYSCAWSVPGKPNTTYTITANAYDAAGNNAATSIQVKTSK